ncbi:MAG: hypothetical protein ACPF9W_07500, partial [Nocardioides sp.]
MLDDRRRHPRVRGVGDGDRRPVAAGGRRVAGRERRGRGRVRRRRARPALPGSFAAARGHGRGPAPRVGRGREGVGRCRREGAGDAGGRRGRLGRRGVVVRPDAATPGDGDRHLAPALHPGRRGAVPPDRPAARGVRHRRL